MGIVFLFYAKSSTQLKLRTLLQCLFFLNCPQKLIFLAIAESKHIGKVQSKVSGFGSERKRSPRHTSFRLRQNSGRGAFDRKESRTKATQPRLFIAFRKRINYLFCLFFTFLSIFSVDLKFLSNLFLSIFHRNDLLILAIFPWHKNELEVFESFFWKREVNAHYISRFDDSTEMSIAKIVVCRTTTHVTFIWFVFIVLNKI